MALSDVDILQAMSEGHITVSPFEERSLQPASIDLHLDRHFLVYDTSKHYVIDPKQPIDEMMRPVEIEGDQPFVLHPGEFALGLIKETTGVSDRMVGRLEGKSSVGRLGVLIHVTAGFLDPGNCLQMTLELHNTANMPVLLYEGMPIAQMAYERLSTKCQNPYGSFGTSKYVGDKKPVASQMWKNFDAETGTWA